MNKNILCVSFFLLIFFEGCAHNDNIMNSWLGMQEGDLIASWGPPNNVTSDGRGGKILIYQNYVDLGQSPGQIQRDSRGRAVSYTAPQNEGYTRQRMFYVNQDGKIYRWMWKGL